MKTLVPKDGESFLTVEVVIDRARAEFKCVVTDQARAMKRLADRLVARKPGIDQQAADEYLQPLAESSEMICANDRHSDERFLKCIVVPNRPIEIVYHFDGHEDTSAELLDRLAVVLDYSVVENDGVTMP